ncbi:ASCH domain-containing protein [Alkalicoccobacillus plakortidis]|uniref:ASCH domain-containing protein n=1 Tax=Alkalicoccobacillus plakortidis TaxID=444060 RepID=A0ABT0XPM8_9BACI|nr:ASCH domain-containing protein [Alkalicoccobacillus plakortidis]MCM2677217.1 ASCH domain-containing protein [Alkalicoccobacillus plakortidis]
MTPEELWIRYKQEYPESPNTYTAWSFGDSVEMANILLELVLSGRKTATSCNYTLAQQQGEELPEVGQMNIVLDGHGEAKGIIRTTHIEVVPFHKVTERFARLEGEGDLSLQH